MAGLFGLSLHIFPIHDVTFPSLKCLYGRLYNQKVIILSHHLMMKHLYSILLLLFIFSPLGAKSRRVSVHTPGSLPTLIGERQKYKLTSLAVEGALNGTDLRFLREMAGSDYR